jgi:hypothetical protein
MVKTLKTLSARVENGSNKGEIMTTTVNTERVLTLQDRCDSCGAAAKVVATFLHGELLFCGHHARKAGAELPKNAVHLLDPEGELNLLH